MTGYSQTLNKIQWAQTFCAVNFPGYRLSVQSDRALYYKAFKFHNNPGRSEILAHIQTGPGVHPASCTMSTGSFPVVKVAGAWC
jgi:hypothetical protein